MLKIIFKFFKIFKEFWQKTRAIFSDLFKKNKPDLQNNLDKKLVFSLNKARLPRLKQLKYLRHILSSKEWLAIKILLIIIILSLIFWGVNFYFTNFLLMPKAGGQYSEGLVGAPLYINPILSQTNDVDSDISRLVFSGLLKYDKNLKLIPDLAENYEVSTDQKIYTFKLRENVLWHDGQKFSANDMVFTVANIKEPAFKSPLMPSLRGVEIKKIDDFKIQFILSEPYPSFLEVLTFGVLPEHIWGNIPPINANLTEYNLKPIGTGPFQFKSLAKDKLGNVKYYILFQNKNYYEKIPYLETVTLKFYPDFQSAISALKNNNIEGISFLPKEFKTEIAGQKNIKQYSFHLPQYTAIFFNQKNNEFLKEKNIRKVLALSINKSKILAEALKLEGEILDSPILPDNLGYNANLEKIGFDKNQAEQILEETGFKKITTQDYVAYLTEQKEKIEKEIKQKLEIATKKDDKKETTENTEKSAETQKKLEELTINSTQNLQEFYRKKDDKILEITLTTVDQPENVKVAELIKEAWQNIGIKVKLEIVSASKITRDIIKPRNYQALIYGEIVGADADPFPFWHSSQNQELGLNLAIFTNREVDKLLEDARKSTDLAEREKNYQRFQNILASEIPAIFLYTPTYTYPVDQKIKGIDISQIITPADRLNNLANWYLKTHRVWRGKQ